MMENRDETQRLRDAFAATSPEDVATPGCPPAEQIWEAVNDELGPTELRQVLHHVASCPVCTESWRLASEIEGESRSQAAQTNLRSAAGRSGRWLSIASAAAAVFAVFVVGITLKDRFLVGSSARSGDAQELALVDGSAAMPRTECRARWVPVEGATYEIQVLTEDFELLTEAQGLSVPEFVVPESLFEGLPAEAVLLMRIQALRPREIPKSRTIRLPC